MLNLDAFRRINHVIEHDATSSTYKFALLKNVIGVVQKYDHFAIQEEGTVRLPLGLVVEGWIFDYLPFVFAGIGQQGARGRILNREQEQAYERLFDTFSLSRDLHGWKEALFTVRSAYETLAFDDAQAQAFFTLAKAAAKTITTMPMKYIGDRHYEIFRPEATTFGRLRLPEDHRPDRSFLQQIFGTFEMDASFYLIFRYLGQNLYGQVTIARRWKEKVCSINPSKCLGDNMIDEMILNIFDDARDTNMVRNLLPEIVTCVWSGKVLPLEKTEIDHLLPYSVWHNNDLWNL